MEELDIRHFKLTNGESVVGLVSVKNETNYIIERPVLIEKSMIGTWSFTPWFPFSETKSFKIEKEHIVQNVPVADTVKYNYVQFALRMSEAHIASPEDNSDLERQLYDEYEDTESVPLEDTDYTIH